MTPDPSDDILRPVAGRAGKGVDSVLPHLQKQQQAQPQPPESLVPGTDRGEAASPERRGHHDEVPRRR